MGVTCIFFSLAIIPLFLLLSLGDGAKEHEILRQGGQEKQEKRTTFITSKDKKIAGSFYKTYF